MNVVSISTFTDWTATVRRQTHTDDRFAHFLLRTPRVAHSIIAAPAQSGLVAAAKRMTRQPRAAFDYPRQRASLFEPKQLRRRQAPTVHEARQNSERYSKRLEAHCRSRGLDAVDIICFNPVLAGYAPFEWARSVTYYSVDDYAEGGVDAGAPWRVVIKAAYSEVARRERAVAAVSPLILRRLDTTAAKLLLPNGVDIETWSTPSPPPEWLNALPRPIITYTGMVDDRLDASLVRRIADTVPKGTILIVGPLSERADRTTLGAISNVTLAGRATPAVVASIVKASDLSVIPHRDTDVTRAMSPLKAYEALGAGQNVVATDLEPLRGLSGHVRLVKNEDSWSEAVLQALAAPKMTPLERDAFLRENSWNRRFDSLLDFARGNRGN